MPIRKVPLVKGSIYHIYNRSIGESKIFNCEADYRKMLDVIIYYSTYGDIGKLPHSQKQKTVGKSFEYENLRPLIDIVAYCIMPTHIHLILKEIVKSGISQFVNRIFLSYSKHCNMNYGRKGPLWEGRFNNVLVETPEQLLHLTRYIHLNPVTAFIVDKPEKWPYSSYPEYIGWKTAGNICKFKNYLEGLNKESYMEFVNSQIEYQRELAKVKTV